MGIKSLTKTIKTNSPSSIKHENLYKLSGKKVAVDASLIIYQQLFNTPGGKTFKNSKGYITNHITGVFYKVMNYISLGIELIFVFDGKPPENKSACIQERKEKSMKAKELSERLSDNLQHQVGLDGQTTRFPDEVRDILWKENFHILSQKEHAQLLIF